MSIAGSGSIRVLAVMSPEPLDGLLAGVPTATEQGYPVEWVTWRGFYVPKDIGDEAYRRWVDVLRTVGASPEWAEARRVNRLEPFFMVGEEFDAFVHQQVEEYREMSREIGLIR